MNASSVVHNARLSSPEFSLAVAACMWPPSENRTELVRQCLDRQIDWVHFLRVVNRHRVVGLANHALAHADCSRIPGEVLHDLKRQAEKQALLSLRTAGEASRLATAFQKAGIPFVILKGVPLAILAYQNLGLRHSRDNDLLVSRRDLMSATQVLSSAGYTRVRPAPGWDEKLVDLYMRYHHDFEYVNRSTGLSAELHYRLHDNSAFGWLMELEDVRRHWRTVELAGGLQVHTLGDEDLPAYLCAHGARHGWFRLKWLADVGALLAQAPDSASRLLERSRLQGTERAAMQALLLCHRFWDTPLPVQLPAANCAVRCLVRTAYSAMVAGKAAVEPYDLRFGISQINLSSFLLSCNPRFLLHQLQSRLFPIGEIERFPTRIRFLIPVLCLPLWAIRKLRFRKALAH